MNSLTISAIHTKFCKCGQSWKFNFVKEYRDLTVNSTSRPTFNGQFCDCTLVQWSVLRMTKHKGSQELTYHAWKWMWLNITIISVKLTEVSSRSVKTSELNTSTSECVLVTHTFSERVLLTHTFSWTCLHLRVCSRNQLKSQMKQNAYFTVVINACFLFAWFSGLSMLKVCPLPWKYRQ